MVVVGRNQGKSRRRISMRLCYIMAIGLTLGALTGCNEPQAVNREEGNLDIELVKTLNNIGVENALIAQHTIYPYHFVADAGELNELGQHDLAVLANHFREHPGTLNVERGNETDTLYEARMAHVLAKLKAAGVETDHMTVSEGMPGGSGMASERLIPILKSEPASGVTGGSQTTGIVLR
jgi:hypothetical protein